MDNKIACNRVRLLVWNNLLLGAISLPTEKEGFPKKTDVAGVGEGTMANAFRGFNPFQR